MDLIKSRAQFEKKHAMAYGDSVLAHTVPGGYPEYPDPPRGVFSFKVATWWKSH